MSHRYTLPLVLLFIGGLLVALSMPVRNIHPILSTILFYLGYGIDATAVVLFIKIKFKKS